MTSSRISRAVLVEKLERDIAEQQRHAEEARRLGGTAIGTTIHIAALREVLSYVQSMPDADSPEPPRKTRRGSPDCFRG